jgi:hypothetical protein
MAPYIYRQTALGETLQESLNELYSSGLVSKELGDRVMLIFDKCMESALANRSNNRVEFKVCRLRADYHSVFPPSFISSLWLLSGRQAGCLPCRRQRVDHGVGGHRVQG